MIRTKNAINVLGLTFDSKMNWSFQVNQSILKAKKSLHALRLLAKYFKREKLITLSTSYFYQRLYYGSQVWLTHKLDSKLKHKLLQASSNCLRIVCKDYNRLFSFRELHILCNRALPMQWSNYVTAMTLFDIYNSQKPDYLYQKFKLKTIYHDRSSQMYLRPTNKIKCGSNCITNRSMNVMKKIVRLLRKIVSVLS